MSNQHSLAGLIEAQLEYLQSTGTLERTGKLSPFNPYSKGLEKYDIYLGRIWLLPSTGKLFWMDDKGHLHGSFLSTMYYWNRKYIKPLRAGKETIKGRMSWLIRQSKRFDHLLPVYKTDPLHDLLHKTYTLATNRYNWQVDLQMHGKWEPLGN